MRCKLHRRSRYLSRCVQTYFVIIESKFEGMLSEVQAALVQLIPEQVCKLILLLKIRTFECMQAASAQSQCSRHLSRCLQTCFIIESKLEGMLIELQAAAAQSIPE